MNPVASLIAFDDIEIDLDARRLRVAAVEAPLEPKAFAVLALLASAPGHAFTRDEILDAVWGHRHVTPGVLNRVIAMLRRALRESERSAPYLHTLHGVGYRFDLPASASVLMAPSESAGAALAQDSVPTDELSLRRRASDLDVAEPLPPASAAPSTSPRAVNRLLIFMVLALLLAIGAWAILRSHRATTLTAAKPSATLVVLPLRHIGDGAADQSLAEGLSDELTTTLARLPTLRVTSTTSATLAAQKGTDLAAIGRQLGVDHALEGSVRSAGAQLRVSLRLVEIASGQTRWAQDYDRDLGDFLAIERDVAQAVASALALQFEANSARQGRVDPEHFRRYLEARNLLREGRVRADEAVQRFRALVAEDANDARAREGLAIALYNLGFANYQVVTVRDEAIVEARRALELDPGLADPHAILAETPCRAAQWEECLGLLRRAIELAPATTRWRGLYAWRLATLGYLSQAREQLALAIAADPLDVWHFYMMGTVLDAIGEHEAARPYIEHGGNTNVNTTRWFNAIWRHDYTMATQLAKDYGDARWRPAMIAITAALQDPTQWPAARAAIEASDRPDGWWNFNRPLLPDPEIAADLVGYENVWKAGFSGVSNYLWAPELANHRHGAEFQDYLRRNHMLEFWRVHGWPDRCKPDGDGVVCE